MIKIKPGFTKAGILAQVKKYNDGTIALDCRHGACSYQTPDGNRCAVGCFIPDGHAGLQVEGSASELISRYPDLEPFIPFEGEDLRQFQLTHDSCHGNVHEAVEKFLNEKCKESND